MSDSAASASEDLGSVDQALDHAERMLSDAPALALQQLDEVERVIGRHPRGDLLRSRAYAASGDLSQAEAVLVDLCASQPAWMPPRLDLARLHVSKKRIDEAIALLGRAVQIEPRCPKIWLMLGDALTEAGENLEADAAYQQHVAHAVFDPVLLQIGNLLFEGRLAQAEQLSRNRLKELPTDVAAIRMLAEVAVRIGRTEEAERLLSRCLELSPGFTEARRNLAMVLHRANKPAEAMAEIDRLLETTPGDPSALNLKAVVLCRIGDYAQGIEIYDQLLQRYTDQPRIWLSYGHALKTAGRTEEAIAAYRRSLDLDAGFGEAWWSLANLKTFRFSQDDVRRMRGINLDGIEIEQRVQLEFALGKADEDECLYDSSFTHYSEGNAQRLRLMPYRAEEASVRVEGAKQLFTREFLDERAGVGCPHADPIFIVGLPRAGSTLVEQILSSHPAVEGTMELPEVISITRELRQSGQKQVSSTYYGVLETLDSVAFREMGERYLQRTRIQRKQGRPFFIDKMPNNFFHVGLIHLMLPNARIIDVRRHPMACCFSGFKQYFARGQNFSYSLQDIGAYYRDYVELMAHFDEVMPGRVHRIIYENLVDDLEGETSRLLEYCGLPFSNECLRFFENDRAVRTASSEQVRRPIYRDGLEHWRHFETWLDPLKDALGDVLDCYPETPPAFRRVN